jgi:hypothetical protein
MISQNPEDKWRREVPPLIFWVLCPKQNLHCYTSNLLRSLSDKKLYSQKTMDNIKSPPYSQTKPILLACQLGILIFLCIIGILENQSLFDAATVVYPLCILFAIIVFWCLFSWTILTKNFFSPYILFLIAAALFNGGHIFLEIFNINPLGILSNQFSSETIVQTIFLVTLSIASLHFGALLSTTTVRSLPTQIVNNLLESWMGIINDFGIADDIAIKNQHIGCRYLWICGSL